MSGFAPTKLNSLGCGVITAELAYRYVDATEAFLGETKFLGPGHKQELATLIRGEASPRMVADTHFLGLYQSYVDRLTADHDISGIRSYWTDVGSLLAESYGSPREDLITVARLKAHLSYTHPIADQVLAVTFSSPQEFFELIPPHIPYSAFSFWISVHQFWEDYGVSILQSPDRYSGRFLIPSLSLIEAIMRCVDDPRVHLYVAEDETEPPLYQELWRHRWCPVALSLQRRRLPEVDRVLDPAANAGHDLIHLANRRVTSRNLGLGD